MSQHDTTSTTAFAPAPRWAPPTYSTEQIAVAPPPAVAAPARNSLLVRLLPVVMAAATAAMMAVFGSRPPGRNPMLLVFPAMMLVSVIVTATAVRTDQRVAELDGDRADYLKYLTELRSLVAKTAAAQYLSLMWCHPDPASLWTLVGGARMWERRPGDSDFCLVRIGTGPRPFARPLVAPEAAVAERSDPVTATALRRFLHTHATIADAPVAIELRGLDTVTISGDPGRARGLMRAMICQLAVMHAPDHLLIAAAISDHNWRYWEWLKWLPHHQHPTAGDGGGPARLAYRTRAEVETAVGELSSHPVVVVIVSDTETTGLAVLGAGAGDGHAGSVNLRVNGADVMLRDADGQEMSVRADQLAAVEAVVCAQRLAAHRVHRSSSDRARTGGTRWQDLLDIDDLTALHPPTRWVELNHCERLRVPLGTTLDGRLVELDIKEAAENGMGPHGLCIGATGSGKSELLRTVALGMMTRHPPDMLNLVLIDFKGGATFLGLERAPHVAAVITNLSDEAPLVARMGDALAGEMNRRQQLLRTAGNLVSVDAYTRARRDGADLPALPALFIIVDEFSELLSQHPDFADTFLAIGRLGRSLGMHLLLASQRLDDGRLRGLESHLSYRVCLKTLSANESRIVLGGPDAFELPNTPGAGFLQTANGESVRFQTAFVSGPCPTRLSRADPGDEQAGPVVRQFTATPMAPVAVTRIERSTETCGPTVLQAVVDELSKYGPAARQIWLPPLAAAPPLDNVLRDAGLTVGERVSSDLTVPIGIVDRPYEQRRTPLSVDLRAAAGNVAVVGAPQSGKSTTLRTLVMALAATHDPRRVQLYCLDFGGGALAFLHSLPHVGALAGTAQPELVARMIDELESIIRSREALFREHSIDSMAQYRRLRAERQTSVAADRFGDVFLVVDGWAGMCRRFPGLEAAIVAVAAQGLSFGVHVVISASRWAEIRPALKDQLGTRIELRLGDPADSELDRKQAQQVPNDKPGRGITPGGLHMLVALPRLDGVESTAGLAQACMESGEMLRRCYGDSAAPTVPLLPELVEHHSVLRRAGDESGGRVLLGLEARRLAPCPVEFDHHQHLLIIGDSECGKTSALRTLCREISRTKTAAQARVVIVDFRRSLLGVVESDHLAGYAISASALEALLPELLTVLQRRMPPPQATREQLRTRSWWSGPELYLVVDDYDLVANTAAGNGLTRIAEYLPYAKDLGLHLVVARRSGGLTRAMFEPLLATMRELGCMGLVMSADPDDGPLFGSVRAAPLPPGRGILVTRGGPQQVQVSWSPPP